MIGWMSALFNVPKVELQVRCIDCGHMKVLRACGRQYCGNGFKRYFPDKGCGCPSFKRGENPVNRGEV